MGGISGKVVIEGKIQKTELEKSSEQLQHRGPNDHGIFVSEDNKIGLTHRKISAIDLSQEEKQPMTIGHLTIVFNGKVYNYLEIKAELQKAGVQFNSNTDTEVILRGYQFWNKGILQQLKGMFAFVIYDDQKKNLFIARDKLGIKPLFYAFQNKNFYFGSELKAIHCFPEFNAQIQASSVSLFLANRFVSNQQTMWQDIYKLPAAHFMTIDTHSLSFQIERYWVLSKQIIDINQDEVQDKFEELLIASLSKQLDGKEQVGAFLSGGLDSSSLVMLMQNQLNYPTQAFSIGFEKWNDSEDKYAKMVAKHTGAKLDVLKLKEIDLSIMPTLMYHYDDPIADISILPTYAVSQLASQNVKAVVSGEGADELLGGYWWHKAENFQPGSNFFSKWWSKISPKSQKDIKNHYIHAMSMGLYDSKELRKALVGTYKAAVPDDVFAHLDELFHSELSTLKQIQYLDIHHFMGELVLIKVERGSMAHGLEARAPFLDDDLLEWIFSLPEKYYIQEGVQKPLLQNLLKGRVPDAILQRPKQGFVGPDIFYKNYDLYQSTLMTGRLVSEQVVKKSYIRQLLLTRDHWRLWKLFVLEHWWRVWVPAITD
ncbi:MAG TPA: asparagine synthase (glutamine-hydrolyzing) [Chitinophagales bacterium]|nr:asparagine synthase (glutamine-hydrolyzing) [Chitinophagales bacterium]